MGKPFTLVVILFLSIATSATAQQSEPLLNFKFSHLSNTQSIDPVFQSASSYSSVNNKIFEFAQYDATWTYPWETKSINIDLGLTLRHLSGFKNSTESSGNRYFQEVLPLLHASALFSLPLKGLYAGIALKFLTIALKFLTNGVMVLVCREAGSISRSILILRQTWVLSLRKKASIWTSI